MHTFNVNAESFANSVIDWLNHVVPRIPGVVLSILIGMLVVRILGRFIRFLLKLTNLQKGLRQLIASAIETLLWILLVIFSLQLMGFQGVLVFFSSSTLAIGILLAAGGSTLLSDLIAGIFLARDTDFNVGDEVMAGDPQVRGTIESMDVRRVRMRDEEGRLHILPNSVVERKEWVLVDRRSTGSAVSALEKATTAAKRLQKVAQEKKVQVKKARPIKKKA